MNMNAYYYLIEYLDGLKHKSKEGIIIDNSYSDAADAIVSNYGGVKEIKNISLEYLGDSKDFIYDLTDNKELLEKLKEFFKEKKNEAIYH